MNEEVVVFLKGRIEDFQSKMKTASGEIDNVGKKGGGAFSKLASVGNVALAGLAGGALAVGTFALKMADDFEQAHARLETAVKNSGANFDDFKGRVAKVDSQLEKFGFTNADVEGNLSTLVNATHNAKTAISLMGLAADIARGRHISLEQATSILAKVETGHVALLGRLGINTKDATGHTISQTEAVKRLAAMYGGQAQASANTFAGKVNALKAAGEDLGKNIGMALIPVIQKLASAMMPVAQFFEKHKTLALALAAVVGGALVAAITAATVAWVAANLAFIATPIGAVITGIVLLVAGIILLWTHWNQVWTWIMHHKAYAYIISVMFPIIGLIVAIVGIVHWFYTNWDSIWKGASAVIRAVWNFISPVILAIGRIIMDVVRLVSAVIHGDWAGAWNAAWKLVVDAWHAMWSAITSIGGAILGWIRGLPGMILGALGDLGSLLIHAGEQLIHGLIQGIQNAAGSIGSTLKGVLGGAIRSIPGIGGAAANILGLASGGIVTKPTLAVVGEAGPEAVIPLSGLATRGVAPLPTGRGSGGGGNSYYISVAVPVSADKASVGRAVVDAIKQYELRSGTAWRN